MSRYFGIDFGTTNISVSCLTVDDGTGNKRIIPYNERGVPYPALVAINEQREAHVASTVKASMVELQNRGFKVIKSVKTILGDKKLKIKIGRIEISPKDVACSLIKGIKKRIEGEYSLSRDELCEATVAVPVDYTREQRRDLFDAFEGAGIVVKKIVSEPVAAYIANMDLVSKYSNVMVFDWGGGTLDLSILNIEKRKVKEVATDGWDVAGDKIDEEIAEFVHHNLLLGGKLTRNDAFADLTENDKLKLLLECEQAKIAFSDGEKNYLIRLPKYCGSGMATFNLSVDDFNEKIFHIVVDAVKKIDSTLKKANMAENDLRSIIMVGGSSKIPLLRNLVESKFPKDRCDVKYPSNPQTSVADGAVKIQYTGCGYSLNQDINVVLGGYDDAYKGYFPILKKGTSIPTEPEDRIKIGFGTLDNAATANFIFVDDKYNILDRVIMPSSGFIGERYYIEADIDKTLVATLSVSCESKEYKKTRTCELTQLSYCCDISKFDDSY